MTASQTERLVYSPEELLRSGDYAEPLFANGVRCHGGFDAAGTYRSPRTVHRNAAIAAWQGQLLSSGHELIEIPATLMPPQHPNVEQARLLLRNGVREPIVRALTLISIIEGFGAMIREVEVPALDAQLVEPFEGTALAHLRSGLFEAHARDESGYRDEGGHKQMWEAARDAALENPKIPGDVLMRLMGRRGRGERPKAAFPQLDPKLERMLAFMANVLVVEVFAEGTFQWGIELLSDPEVSAAPEEAGRMVEFIQADEKPHVQYLRTALSEVRARSLRTLEGGELSGRIVIDGLLHRVLDAITRNRRSDQRDDLREGLVQAMQAASNPDALLEEFDSLETQWTPPPSTGFESSSAAA
jgi:hypothetical protein